MFRGFFWIWLAILLLTWGFGILNIYDSLIEVPAIVLFSAALFFSIYFLLPLFRKNELILSSALVVLALIVTAVFLGASTELPNLFTLIIFSYLAGEATYRLTKRYALIAGSLIGLCLIIYGIQVFPLSFLVIYIVVHGLTLAIFHKLYYQYNEIETRYETLLHEYRTTKRKSLTDEKLARQEERTQIGREIHDSVGHKLTNLLMQLEVARMEVDDQTKERIVLLKELAKDSLEETRRAVKAMRQEEIGGLSSIIHLIRKLEAESFLRIHFSVKNRAFSANLNTDQTVAVYRAVQEALTNVMRHSSVREATVLFESPGESIFRFEVINPVEVNYSYVEGYGLSSMRERVEQAGGNLEILTFQNKFVIRGTFPLNKKGADVHEESAIS
ncbi:histidine kinase [Bacillaceae bacterium W0354]